MRHTIGKHEGCHPEYVSSRECSTLDWLRNVSQILAYGQNDGVAPAFAGDSEGAGETGGGAGIQEGATRVRIGAGANRIRTAFFGET